MYCTKEQVKEDLNLFFARYETGDWQKSMIADMIRQNAEKIIEAFESVDYDMDAFVKDRIYRSLNGKIAYLLLNNVCLKHVPALEKCIADKEKSPIDLTKIRFSDDVYQKHSFSRNEILRHLYFCDTPVALWDYLAQGIGDLKALHKWYQDQSASDPELLQRFEAFFDIQPEEKKLVFSIEDDEVDKYMAFRKAHLHKGTGGKMGDSFEVIFYESGVGCIAIMKCLECGETEILTDLDSL